MKEKKNADKSESQQKDGCLVKALQSVLQI